MGYFFVCAGQELNLHALRRYHLKVVRLPFRHPRIARIKYYKTQLHVKRIYL